MHDSFVHACLPVGHENLSPPRRQKQNPPAFNNLGQGGLPIQGPFPLPSRVTPGSICQLLNLTTVESQTTRSHQHWDGQIQILHPLCRGGYTPPTASIGALTQTLIRRLLIQTS